jgi:hypothetical protein
MKAIAVALAAIVLLGGLSSAAAAPPEDIAAYCRTIHPQVPFQVRCLNLENAAAARVGRIGPGPDPEGWNRCRNDAPSWSAMEQCLAESTTAATAPASGAAGAAAAPGGAVKGDRPAEPAPGAPAGAAAPAAPPPVAAPPAPPAPAGNVPPSSTVILGPRPTPPAPAERERQTRAISEEDADRQLRSVLERNPSARCEKKQYGPGWVITCE